MRIGELNTADLRFTDFRTKQKKCGGEIEISKVFVERSAEGGRSRPLIFGKRSVSTFGLRRVSKGGNTSHYYYPIVFSENDEDWVDEFHEMAEYIEKYVRDAKRDPLLSFEGFDPIKEVQGEQPTMFLRVGNSGDRLFARFVSDTGAELSTEQAIDRRGVVDVTIKIESILISSNRAFLQVCLIDATERPRVPPTLPPLASRAPRFEERGTRARAMTDGGRSVSGRSISGKSVVDYASMSREELIDRMKRGTRRA